MSRVAKKPITVPKGVEVKIAGDQVAVKGVKGALSHRIPALVEVKLDGQSLSVGMREKSPRASMFAGTTRAHLANLEVGS